MTKPMLAVVTMRLVEAGVLRLGDPVERWLPELAEPKVLRRIDGPLEDTVPAHRSITVEDLLTSRMGTGVLTEPTFNPPPPEQAARLPAYYLTDPESGKLAPQPVSTAAEWSTPPVFESGAGGLLSTADDLLAFARLLRNHGVHDQRQHLSRRSVELLTRNQLTEEQIAVAGFILGGTVWCNDPQRDLIAIALAQTSGFLFNGGRDEFLALSLRAVQPGSSPAPGALTRGT